jgi:hypothetical protein
MFGKIKKMKIEIFIACIVIGSLCLSVSSCSSKKDIVTRPMIKKLGTIDCDLVETTPVVFKGRLYRFEYVRENYKPNQSGDSYFRFIDHETGKPTPAFARGFHLGSAFVEGDTVYVTGVNIWNGERIRMFASTDLQNWTNWTVLYLPGYGIFNTSLCKADDRYVLMYELGKPKEEVGQRFTARFAKSKDLRHWKITPKECNYDKNRYTAPHCLRYLDGFYYVFYVEELRRDNKPNYETYVVRSKDLITWASSPLNPVMQYSDDDKKIANPNLTAEQREHIAGSTNVNNSDIDFCEFKGKVIINYAWGNQQGTEFLAEAEYHGTLNNFLAGWFPGSID